jgi:glycosyltransferase involved in cell wall biosynthesis
MQLRARLARGPVDVLHAHTRVSQVVAWALSHACRIPFVTTWHGFFKPRWFRRVLPCTGDKTIAISQPVADHLREVFRIPDRNLRVILHGIDVDRVGQPVDAARRAAVRRQLDVPEAGVVIGTVTRLVPSKGVDQLIRAFRLVHRQRPDARLLIIGDGEDRARLERIVAEDGLGAAVRFAGAVDETASVLAAMDLFVFMPATEEGFGLSLLEAMASGVPIVGVRRGQGAAWVLDQSQAGVIVPPSDDLALARAIDTLLTDRAHARQLVARARQVVTAQYSLARVAGEVDVVYRDVLAAATVRRAARGIEPAPGGMVPP